MEIEAPIDALLTKKKLHEHLRGGVNRTHPIFDAIRPTDVIFDRYNDLPLYF